MKSFFAPVSKNHSPGTPKKEISARKISYTYPKNNFLNEKFFTYTYLKEPIFYSKKSFLYLHESVTNFLQLPEKQFLKQKVSYTCLKK